MAAGGSEDAAAFEVATWRVVTLFLLILLIDGLVEFVDEFITHRLRNRKKHGLSHAWSQLKFETMALGVVSLLLVVFEVRLSFGLQKQASEGVSDAEGCSICAR